jgi:RecA-family ATPase
VTVCYGLPDHCKSALAHKVAVVVASEALDFDGLPTLHGPVLFITADSGARKKQVINRMRKISARLNAPYTDRLVIVDDAVNLLEPASVAKLLEKHPGPWAMIVIDPLVKCVGGADLAQAGVMTPALTSAMRIGLETGAAIMVVTHEPRGDKGHAYGSIFGDADATAILHVVRRFKDQARDGDAVTVAVEKLKNDSAPDKPFAYHIEGAYLAAAGESAGKRSVPPEGIKRADIRALLPTTATAKAKARKLIEGLLVGTTPESRGEEWRRLWKSWADAGLVVVKGDTIRRV